MFLTKKKREAIVAQAKEETMREVRAMLKDRRSTGPHSVDSIMRCKQHPGNFEQLYTDGNSKRQHYCWGHPTEALIHSTQEMLYRQGLVPRPGASRKQAEAVSKQVGPCDSCGHFHPGYACVVDGCPTETHGKQGEP